MIVKMMIIMNEWFQKLFIIIVLYNRNKIKIIRKIKIKIIRNIIKINNKLKTIS